MTDFETAAHTIHSSGIVAYPTESVYGIGCDPTNQTAVEKLCRIKQRDINKGFILIGSCFEQLSVFCAPIPDAYWEKIDATWPGPYTWLFPCSQQCPPWLHGAYDTIAVRVTAYPLAAKLCDACNSALVSTSANISDSSPAQTSLQVKEIFAEKLDYIIVGEVGHQTPTPIRDTISDELIRP